jgi:dCMP deaminase
MGFDKCICTHAEQAAIGHAATKGISTAGALVYTNVRPCINCVKLLLASDIRGVIFAENWVYDDELEERYKILTNTFRQFAQMTNL